MTAAPVFVDTIAAIATATGNAGVGIVRVSGPDAFAVADRLREQPGAKRRKPATHEQPGHTLRRVVIRDPNSNEPIDDALLAVFHAPRSLTGENVVEIQGHGGTVTMGLVLAAALRAGARLARPGEFTYRAFVNGKMDLAQAEAVADLVSAQTVAAQRAARRQRDGVLSASVRAVTDRITDALALIEASIDFPEEIGDADPAAVDAPLAIAQAGLDRLLETARYGKRLQSGVTVTLTGRPNVGKSSLLNALAGWERAIVTDVPGTTRDIVEEALHLGGIPVRALDTAGIRDTDDAVEQIGVERARRAADNADVVVVVLDAATGLLPDDTFLLERFASRPFVVAINKSDRGDAAVLRAQIEARHVQNARIVETAAPVGTGIPDLASAIAETATGGAQTPDQDAPLVTSVRHEAALLRARESLIRARATVAHGLPLELIAVDAHAALGHLGEITGETAREDIIAGIFSRFCLGK